MLFNIHTGRVEGVTVRQEEIVYLTSSIQKLQAERLTFVFTDRHAYVQGARYHVDTSQLTRLDWPLIQSRDFKRDPDDPGKLERRAAECLVHQHVPTTAILGIACMDQKRVNYIAEAVTTARQNVKVALKPTWFFE